MLAVIGMVSAVLLSGLALPSGVPVEATAAHPTTRQQSQPIRLRAAVRQLPIATETRSGYDRDKFRMWVDADADCLYTRDEVLRAESRTTPRIRSCDVVRGRWVSYYDEAVWTHPSDVDIDHLVPLAEAWDSGARRWNAVTRERYANDLGDPRALVAVTDNVNQSKGDQDINEWLPSHRRCRYLTEWTAVKTRWSLRVDAAEKRAMRRLAAGCPNPRLRVSKARIGLHHSRPPGGGGDQLGRRISITEVVYDPPGADTENTETLTLTNRDKAVSLAGFRLRDSAGAVYRFPQYRLRHAHSVVIHSGHGRQRSGHLYADWGFTWNNDGDAARLTNPSGTLVDSCHWGDGSGTTTC